MDKVNKQIKIGESTEYKGWTIWKNGTNKFEISGVAGTRASLKECMKAIDSAQSETHPRFDHEG